MFISVDEGWRYIHTLAQVQILQNKQASSSYINQTKLFHMTSQWRIFIKERKYQTKQNRRNKISTSHQITKLSIVGDANEKLRSLSLLLQSSYVFQYFRLPVCSKIRSNSRKQKKCNKIKLFTYVLILYYIFIELQNIVLPLPSKLPH